MRMETDRHGMRRWGGGGAGGGGGGVGDAAGGRAITDRLHPLPSGNGTWRPKTEDLVVAAGEKGTRTVCRTGRQAHQAGPRWDHA